MLSFILNMFTLVELKVHGQVNADRSLQNKRNIFKIKSLMYQFYIVFRLDFLKLILITNNNTWYD